MTRSTFIAAGLALAAVLPAIPAQATQAASLTRTFVSSAGNDSNPCTITQPCATFAQAYSLTAAQGIIAALDPGKYGPLTITGPVTINGNGWAAITGPASDNAITINANSGDKITLIGLEIDGAGAASNGIRFTSGGSLTVRNSVIRDFTNDGIDFLPNSSTKSHIFVSNTSVSDNGGNAIGIHSTGSGAITGVLDHINLEDNANLGLNVDSSTANMFITVSDSVSANNGGSGINATNGAIQSGQGTSVGIMVRNSTIVNNGNGGLETVSPLGGFVVIFVTRSTIMGNSSGWIGEVFSYVDNDIEMNVNANSEPQSQSPLNHK